MEEIPEIENNRFPLNYPHMGRKKWINIKNVVAVEEWK